MNATQNRLNQWRRISDCGLRISLPLCAALLLASLCGTAAQQTNRASGRVDYSSFRGISERNIFNASRSGGRVATTREVRRPTRVDTVALVGTLQADNGPVAFFDGSSSEFRKALKPKAKIAGYTIREIAFNNVQLEAGDKKLELRVGHSLRREDGGEWKVSTTSGVVASATPGASGSGSNTSSRDSGRYDRSRSDRERDGRDSRETASAPPPAAESPTEVVSDAVDEVLRRLMEQREREDR